VAKVSLSLLVLKTRQVDDLRRFYGRLGIDFAEERHGRGPVHYARRVGDIVLEIYPLAGDDVPVDATTRLGFNVEDLSEVVQAMRSSGAAIVNEPEKNERGARAVVRDPDGRSVELYQR
jgi:catechol 2,3-dioxygenase-like lactoylglutathione lyase family enzyme